MLYMFVTETRSMFLSIFVHFVLCQVLDENISLRNVFFRYLTIYEALDSTNLMKI